MAKLGVGLLGVGEMGKRHAENLRRLVPDAHLVAVTDVDAARARNVATELEIEHWYDNFEAMLERRDIDAVLIASSDRFHARAIQTSVSAKKDIFCDKPLALNLNDVYAALVAVERAGVLLLIGYVQLYVP